MQPQSVSLTVMLHAGLPIGVALALGFVGGAVIRLYGFAWGLTDSPNARSSHRIPRPKGGGIGILAAFVAAAWWWNAPWPLWTSATAVAIASLAGDVRDLSFKPRLAVQLCCATLAAAGRWYQPSSVEMPVLLPTVLVLFSAFWLTAVANWYNFMDGIDGLAGVTGVIAFALLGIYGLAQGEVRTGAMVQFAVSGACAGFLIHNFPRARVFMGDVGSVLLGYLFAGSVLYASRSIEEALLLSSFILPFYCDEVNTLLSRMKSGETLTTAHRRHVYQILANQAQIPHPMVTFVYAALQTGIALLAWASSGNLPLLLITLACTTIALLVAGEVVRRRWESCRG